MEQITKVSDMLRATAGNTHELMLQIAEHIDKLEAGVIGLQQRIEELEKSLPNATE